MARRLSSAEYDHTIRDLLGVDVRPAATFPVDPANEAGFDNSGESLMMSPALVNKYLAAAQKVSDHLAITPSGIEFAPHSVITDTDRDKFCVNRIIDFYRRQKTQYEDFLMVLWRYENREALGISECSIADLAQRTGVSPRYCQTLWRTIQENRESVGPIAAIQAMWKQMPVVSAANSSTDAEANARVHCKRIDEFVTKLRQSLVPNVPNLTVPQINSGSQPLVLWKNRQFVANRREFVGEELPSGDFGLPADSEASAAMEVEPTDGGDEARRQAFVSGLNHFCNVFPDAFFISERARVYLDPKGEQDLTGRYLSAGFHSQMGYFRDDAPLYDLILSEIRANAKSIGCGSSLTS